MNASQRYGQVGKKLRGNIQYRMQTLRDMTRGQANSEPLRPGQRRLLIIKKRRQSLNMPTNMVDFPQRRRPGFIGQRQTNIGILPQIKKQVEIASQPTSSSQSTSTYGRSRGNIIIH